MSSKFSRHSAPPQMGPVLVLTPWLWAYNPVRIELLLGQHRGVVAYVLLFNFEFYFQTFDFTRDFLILCRKVWRRAWQDQTLKIKLKNQLEKWLLNKTVKPTYVISTPSSLIFFCVSQRTYAESTSRSSATSNTIFGLKFRLNPPFFSFNNFTSFDFELVQLLLLRMQSVVSSLLSLVFFKLMIKIS